MWSLCAWLSEGLAALRKPCMGRRALIHSLARGARVWWPWRREGLTSGALREQMFQKAWNAALPAKKASRTGDYFAGMTTASDPSYVDDPSR